MNHKQRMLDELPYLAMHDGLKEDHYNNRLRIEKYNKCRPDKVDKLEKMARKILGKAGKNLRLTPPIRFDYGINTEVGDNFFSNYNLTVLDVAKVKIGNNCMFAPNVSLYTAGHPIHPDARNTHFEYGIGITIGDNVWLGGNVVVVPGVHIGNNVVVGAGSVVTHDIPSNSVAVGNPARVIRTITDEDKKYYYKNREFDIDIFSYKD